VPKAGCDRKTPGILTQKKTMGKKGKMWVTLGGGRTTGRQVGGKKEGGRGGTPYNIFHRRL